MTTKIKLSNIKLTPNELYILIDLCSLMNITNMVTITKECISDALMLDHINSLENIEQLLADLVSKDAILQVKDNKYMVNPRYAFNCDEGIYIIIVELYQSLTEV